MGSSMSSQSDRSDRTGCPRLGRRHREETHMKINLPIFKDEDAKDMVTYHSWIWDLTVYRHAGCRDRTLLPNAIRSLQGYPGKLVRSSGTDITLDGILTILDEHYNNVKALRRFESRSVPDEDGQQRNHVGLGCPPLPTFTDISSILSRPIPPRLCSQTKERLIQWWTS